MGKKQVVYGILAILLLSVTGFVLNVWMGEGLCSLSLSPPHLELTEFEEVNQSGVYTTEVIDAYETTCSSGDYGKGGVRVATIELILRDGNGEIVFNVRAPEIDMNYSGNNETWQNHSSNVSKDNGTIFPVHFNNKIDESLGEEYDYYNDSREYILHKKIYLSEGDEFRVYGSGSEADGPAEKGWSLHVHHTMTGEIAEVTV